MFLIFILLFLVNYPKGTGAKNHTEYGRYSVAGFPTSIKEYPSAVYLESPGTKCTGTLISRRFILTAAHCVKKKYMLAYTGHSLKNCGRINEVLQAKRHPNYRLHNVNDVAVLKLKHQAEISKRVKLLHMATEEDVFPVGTICLIAGWGRLSRIKKKLTRRLHYGLMKIVDPKCCEGKSHFNKQREICAGKIDFLQHITGKGDSGTALRCYRRSDGNFVLAGIDSRAPAKNLTIFTKVSFYRNWIDSILSSMDSKRGRLPNRSKNYNLYLYLNLIQFFQKK